MKHKIGIAITFTICAVVIVLYVFIAPGKLSALSRVLRVTASLVGSGFAFAAARRLDREDANRRGWFLLGAWLAWFFAGEVAQETYYAILRKPPPLPSVGDIFFLAGYGFLLAALARFFASWRASGFPLGSARKHMLLAIATSLVLLAINVALLRPVVQAPLAPGERFIAIVYPILDSVVLVPTVILLAMALRFRGGRVWAVWAALLAGIGFVGASDIAFNYVTSLHMSWVRPLLHVSVIFSYIFGALGAFQQWVLLTE